MNWKKINIDKLPENEVLAANFEEGTNSYRDKLIGYLHIEDKMVCCENEHESLENCTHYIDINKYDV